MNAFKYGVNTVKAEPLSSSIGELEEHRGELNRKTLFVQLVLGYCVCCKSLVGGFGLGASGLGL